MAYSMRLYHLNEKQYRQYAFELKARLITVPSLQVLQMMRLLPLLHEALSDLGVLFHAHAAATTSPPTTSSQQTSTIVLSSCTCFSLCCTSTSDSIFWSSSENSPDGSPLEEHGCTSSPGSVDGLPPCACLPTRAPVMRLRLSTV